MWATEIVKENEISFAVGTLSDDTWTLSYLHTQNKVFHALRKF